MLEMAQMYAKGLPPVAGGVYDQTKVFVEAARYVWREQRGYEAMSGGGAAALARALGI